MVESDLLQEREQKRTRETFERFQPEYNSFPETVKRLVFFPQDGLPSSTLWEKATHIRYRIVCKSPIGVAEGNRNFLSGRAFSATSVNHCREVENRSKVNQPRPVESVDNP